MKRKTLPEVDEYAMCDYDLKKDEVAAFTNEYVLGNWNFEDASAKIEYLKHRVGHLAYEYFPSGLDERMVLVARLMALLYLIGESLVELDLEDGEDYLGALDSAAKGYWLPDDNIPAVWMLCGTLDEMRAVDYLAVDDIWSTSLAHLSANLVRRGRPQHRHDSYRVPASLRLGYSLVGALEPFAIGHCLENDFSSP